jgi:hypothetical protein
MTLVAVVLAGRARQIEAQRTAIGAVRQLQGAVFDEQPGFATASRWEHLWFGGVARPRYISFRQSRILFDQPERLQDLHPHLKQLDCLRSLSLESTAIDDEQLALLEDLTQLRLLTLRGTPVTSAAVSRLQERLPNCTIVY